MQTVATVVVSSLIASSAAVVVATWVGRGEPSDELRRELLDVRAAHEQLQSLHAQLQGRLDAMLENPIEAASSGSLQRVELPTLSSQQVAAAVEAYLATRGGEVSRDEAASARPFDLARDLDGLAGSSYWSAPEQWKRAFDAGRMDDVIDALQERVDAAPNDVDARMDLANACLAYLQMDNSKWAMSMQADRQFDAVLDIDDSHWGARFSKAVSYTFWPDFLGKDRDAIRHFERLVEQQQTMQAEPRHAQTYLYLGNMLSESNPERARSIWQQGLARHPESQELRQRLGN